MMPRLIGSFFIFCLAVVPLEASASPAKVEIKKSQLPLPANAWDYELIRVLVQKSSPSLMVGTAFPYELFDETGGFLFSGKRIAPTRVSAVEGGIQIGRQSFKTNVMRLQIQEGEITVGKRKYHHSLDILKDEKGQLKAVSELSMEEYLKGVLPVEASPAWGMEFLKAHAIVSRTYALFNLLEKEGKAYAVAADVSSQVYGGLGTHHPRTDAAVDETSRQILTYKGKIFPAYFHSTCGGATARADKVWTIEKHPSLMGVECEFCRGSKHYRWDAVFTLKQIEARLKKNGFNAVGVSGVSAEAKDESGRVTHFLIQTARGEKKISSNGFRMFISPSHFKSTLLTSIKKVPEGYKFQGKGWGHGVGFCQYGAKKLAELGYNHRQILAFYYPHSSITYFPPAENSPAPL